MSNSGCRVLHVELRANALDWQGQTLATVQQLCNASLNLPGILRPHRSTIQKNKYCKQPQNEAHKDPVKFDSNCSLAHYTLSNKNSRSQELMTRLKCCIS